MSCAACVKLQSKGVAQCWRCRAAALGRVPDPSAALVSGWQAAPPAPPPASPMPVPRPAVVVSAPPMPPPQPAPT
eukprot:6743990-Prymnesium_polylepis.1